MIDFATNYNYLGPPNGIHDFIRANIEDVVGSYINYKDNSVIDAISSYLDVPTENIARGNGASEIIYGLPPVLHQDRAVWFAPSFWQYQLANERVSVDHETIDLLPEDDFSFDLDKLENTLHVGAAAVYLCSPNNPTGSMVPRSELLELADVYSSSDFVVDETYLQFREDFAEATLSNVAVDKPNIHIVHSLSKFFTSPGLRSGALVSNADTTAAFKRAQVPHTTSPLSHIVTPWLLNQADFIEESRHELAIHKEHVTRVLGSCLGERISFTYPTANFILAKVHKSQLNVTEKLAERSILVRDGKAWSNDMADYFRFCIRDDFDTALLVQALEEITDV